MGCLKPEYEEIRSKIRANTLVAISLRLDFTPLISANDFAIFLQKQLCPAGFDYREDFLRESEMRINDPIEKDERNFPKLLENERTYKFTQDDRMITFSRFFLLYQLSAVSKNFTEEIAQFAEIIEQLKKQSPYFNIVRLGIRKTNLVVAKDFEQLFKCFRQDFLPLSAIGKADSKNFGMFESQENFFAEDLQIACNIRKRLESGEAQIFNEKNEPVGNQDVLRFILELETYSRGGKALTKLEDYQGKLEQMNAGIFFFYLEHLTEEFIAHLQAGVTDDLFAGVNKNVAI